MKNKQGRIVPVWGKTGYIIAAGIMAGLLIAGVILAFSFGRSFEEGRYFKMVIAIYRYTG